MNDDIEPTCKGFTISLEHKETDALGVICRKRMMVALSDEKDKWVVKGEGYQGFFKDLDHAYNEACRHLRFKLKTKYERMNEDE
jgi:hypothetical protein